MQLIMYRQAMAVVRLEAGSPPPSWAVGHPLASVTLTPDETSVVVPTSSLPDEIPGEVESPFTVVRVAGTLEFTQVGVMVKLLKPLADAGITVLTVSTFDTDWVLVPASRDTAAASVWRGAGHEVITDDGILLPEDDATGVTA